MREGRAGHFPVERSVSAGPPPSPVAPAVSLVVSPPPGHELGPCFHTSVAGSFAYNRCFWSTLPLTVEQVDSVVFRQQLVVVVVAVAMISTVRELQRALSIREQELRERESRLRQLERDVGERDAVIVQLRAELDKCHQVLKPMVQQLSTSLQSTYISASAAPVAANAMANIAPWRVGAAASASPAAGTSLSFLLQQQRTKRLAISAEPLPHSMGNASLADLRKLRIQRAPKSEQ